MRMIYSALMLVALCGMLVGCGGGEAETPPPGVDTEASTVEIETGDEVPAADIEKAKGEGDAEKAEK